MRSFFCLPQMRKIKIHKKKLAAARLEPGSSDLPSTTLPTTLSRSSLVNELKIAYMKKIFKKNFELQKNL